VTASAVKNYAASSLQRLQWPHSGRVLCPDGAWARAHPESEFRDQHGAWWLPRHRGISSLYTEPVSRVLGCVDRWARSGRRDWPPRGAPVCPDLPALGPALQPSSDLRYSADHRGPHAYDLGTTRITPRGSGHT